MKFDKIIIITSQMHSGKILNTLCYNFHTKVNINWIIKASDMIKIIKTITIFAIKILKDKVYVCMLEQQIDLSR